MKYMNDQIAYSQSSKKPEFKTFNRENFIKLVFPLNLLLILITTSILQYKFFLPLCFLNVSHFKPKFINITFHPLFPITTK